MDEFTGNIKILNEVYASMKKSFNTLEKLFKKNSNIHQKIILTKQFMDDVYRSIYEKMESDTINDEFLKIIRGISHENRK